MQAWFYFSSFAASFIQLPARHFLLWHLLLLHFVTLSQFFITRFQNIVVSLNFCDCIFSWTVTLVLAFSITVPSLCGNCQFSSSSVFLNHIVLLSFFDHIFFWATWSFSLVAAVLCTTFSMCAFPKSHGCVFCNVFH